MFNELGNANKFKGKEEERKLKVQEILRNKYTKHAYLFSEPLEVLIEKGLDKYLYTSPYYNYSYSEINADLDKIINERLKEEQEKNKQTPKEESKRKKMIDLCVEKFYTRFPQFYPESLDELKNKAYARYISNEQYNKYDYPQIITELAEDCERRRKQQKNLKEIANERHYDLNDLFDCRVSGNCLHIHVVPKDVKADIANAGGPTNYVNNVVAPKLDDALVKIGNILQEEEKDVNVVVAVSPTLRLAQNVFSDRGFTVGETNNPRFTEMFGQTKIFEASIPSEEIIKLVNQKPEEKTEPIEENTANDDLNDMVEESTEVKQEITTTNEIEKPKQFVKTDNSSNNQSGSVSIFGIGIAILSIVAFVLVAMILNLLLK